MDPWNKIGGAAMRKLCFLVSCLTLIVRDGLTRSNIGMLLRILEVDPAKRITIEGLNEMDWFTQ